MARQRTPPITVDRVKAQQDQEFLEAMATELGGDHKVRARATLILAMLAGADLKAAAQQARISVGTAKDKVQQFNAGGWKSLLTVMAPRGGDFLARYDQGFWAERLTRAFVDRSMQCRAIPYGTSRSEPFTDMQSFRQYMENEFLLQAWSADGRWKRPDLLLVPRDTLREEKGNGAWTPDLKHLDNNHCRPYVEKAKAAIEVETSLWQVSRATVQLSFTVKQEDLDALRNWTNANTAPLFIIQVFYDCAYALSFSTLEEVIGVPQANPRHVAPKPDRITKKDTYKIPLAEGVCLGSIPEPDVEGKIFKAENGKVTVYGRLTGSVIEPTDIALLEQLVAGTLRTGRNDADAAAEPRLPEADDESEFQGVEDE